jgi:hypothetical protein
MNIKLIAFLLIFCANAFATTPEAVTTTAPTDGKVHFEIFTPNDINVSVGQPLQLLHLEKSRPDLFTVTPRYFISPKEKFKSDTFWKTAFVTKYHRGQLAEWLQCVYFDPETHTCGPLLGIDFKTLQSKEKELRKELVHNHNLSKDYKSVNNAIFINQKRYEGPLVYGQLLHVVNDLLPKEKRLTKLGKYESTRLYVIGTDKGIGARDLALERELLRWVPNLEVEYLAPSTSKAQGILKAVDAKGIPAYVFDKKDSKNIAIQKLARAGRIKIKPSQYAIYELRSGLTEIRTGTKEVPNQLDLWVMSQCPFGVKAESAIMNAKAQKIIPENMKINLRYIVSERKVDGKKTWQSLHGEPELTENMRQLAIQKAWPDKLWSYLEARNKDYNSENWKDAAVAAGLNPTEVESKMGLGRKLLAQDIKDGEKLNINGSPTYLWQNRYVLNTGEEMKAALGFNVNDYNEPTARTPAEKKQAVAPAESAPAKCGS